MYYALFFRILRGYKAKSTTLSGAYRAQRIAPLDTCPLYILVGA